jgi:hypothetical protein
MRGLTGAVIGSAATAAVLIGGFALAHYQSTAAAQAAACSRSLGYVQWTPHYAESNNAFQVNVTADDAYNTAQDGGAPGLSTDLRTLMGAGSAWTGTRTAAVQAEIISDVKKVYSDCGRPYTPQP